MNTRAHNPLAEVGAFLAEQPDIRLGIVFGSVAEGHAKPGSDLDIAVLAKQPLGAEQRMQLIDGLARITGRPVDLVDLTTAGVAVARSALRSGKRVFARDAGAYPAVLSRMLIDSADFLPYRTRLLKERRQAWIQ